MQYITVDTDYSTFNVSLSSTLHVSTTADGRIWEARDWSEVKQDRKLPLFDHPVPNGMGFHFQSQTDIGYAWFPLKPHHNCPDYNGSLIMETEIESGGNEIQAERRTDSLLQYCHTRHTTHISTVLFVEVAVVENHTVEKIGITISQCSHFHKLSKENGINQSTNQPTNQLTN